MYEEWLSVATFRQYQPVDGFPLSREALNDMPLGVLIPARIHGIHVDSREFT